MSLTGKKGRPLPPAGKHRMQLIEIRRVDRKGQAPGLVWIFEVVEGQPHAGCRANRSTNSEESWKDGDHLDRLLVEMGIVVEQDEEFDFETLYGQEFTPTITTTGVVKACVPVKTGK